MDERHVHYHYRLAGGSFDGPAQRGSFRAGDRFLFGFVPLGGVGDQRTVTGTYLLVGCGHFLLLGQGRLFQLVGLVASSTSAGSKFAAVDDVVADVGTCGDTRRCQAVKDCGFAWSAEVALLQM